MPKPLGNQKHLISPIFYTFFSWMMLWYSLFATKRVGERGHLVKSTFVCRRNSPHNQNNDLGKSLGWWADYNDWIERTDCVAARKKHISVISQLFLLAWPSLHSSWELSPQVCLLLFHWLQCFFFPLHIQGKKSKEQMKVRGLTIQKKKMGIILFIFKSSCRSD